MKKTAEFVSLGHPDKTADYISSYILDRMLAQGQWRATAKFDGITAGFHLSSLYSPVG